MSDTPHIAYGLGRIVCRSCRHSEPHTHNAHDGQKWVECMGCRHRTDGDTAREWLATATIYPDDKEDDA